MSDDDQGGPLRDDHDPYQPYPGEDEDRRREVDGAPDADHRSLLEHRALPAVAVAVAVLVVVAAIFIGGGSDEAVGPKGDTTPQTQGGPAATDAAGTVPPKANPCPGFSYGANLLGEPRVAADPGVHVWQDIYGFHIRLVPGPASVDAVSGTVAWEGDELVLDAADPSGATVADGRIVFDLAGDKNEVNFRAACGTKSMTVELTSAGARLDPAIITVGQGKDQIKDNPVVLVRGG